MSGSGEPTRMYGSSSPDARAKPPPKPSENALPPAWADALAGTRNIVALNDRTALRLRKVRTNFVIIGESPPGLPVYTSVPTQSTSDSYQGWSVFFHRWFPHPPSPPSPIPHSPFVHRRRNRRDLEVMRNDR